ncbi:MAG: bifunctional demethylmenaquinone methyltransferase/2-methoxy-6-polyprenyl-1,4-benzoquinol methylase UbiE [Deltaproteobacteria bacterium]|nr:bifunctional demethylmenaquinone methyltransferase/2-methoxy-6-polyprenyl-1,4-benzoquinol methylase UbiE [Deltaproteobacteria bacterium]MBW2069842.1 bifunctional demethylmenaquinone methyltransferase/2-methoxy-6-polyprenyl-1,4-benzoquinol methylase UbiE [Deltaproteobacteria bacterium]
MKDSQVKRMFETIAFSYDFQNSFLSLRRDIYWRRVLAECLRVVDSGLILDVATGTAEVAIEVCKRHKNIRVIGVDFSPRMLAIGRKKVQARGMAARIHLSLADARCLPLKSGSVDAVTIAFGIRNIQEKGLVLQEFWRVLRQGGQLLIMEFDLPDDPFLGGIYRFYFDYLMPVVGNWLSRTNYAYSYLADSVHNFPTEEQFMKNIAEAGFTPSGVRKLTYGIAKIFMANKKAS